MLIAEGLRWRGRVKVIARYLDGRVEVEEFENLITNAGKNMVRDMLDGTVTDGAVKYIELGSGNTPPAGAQVALITPQFRKLVTQQTLPGTGAVRTVAYIAPGEANGFTIHELGWFAGAAATAATGSGIMIARVLYNRAKTNLESLQIERTDTFT